MKLQAELETVVNKFAAKKGAIVAHAAALKESGGYKDFETRLAWDALNGLIGSSWICDMYDKYNCSDEHISTLAKKALKIVLN